MKKMATEIKRGRHAPGPPPPFATKQPDDTVWPYWWNAPREAISRPDFPTHAELHARDREFYELFAAMNRAYEMLDCQPDFVQRSVFGAVNSLEETNGTKRANLYLTRTFVERIYPRLELVNAQYRLDEKTPDNVNLFWWFNRLADMSRKEANGLAGDIALFITGQLSAISESAAVEDLNDFKSATAMYRRAAEITRGFRQPVPLESKKHPALEDLTPAIARMFAPKWWENRLRRYGAMWREHLRIAFGQVSKKTTPYASKNAIADWREQKRRTREFLKSMELEDEEGNRIDLLSKYDGSVANPAIRRCELMVRIRGFEDICQQLGYVGEFYTITAPSKYHATNVHGHRNPKWEGASPADTQKYLCRLWAAVRAKLARADIRIFGIRVAEPHQDGTPHWHMLMFMKSEHIEKVRAVMEEYAMREDADELTSERTRRARFCVEAIDPEKGSATGYVAKYISKNIDGYQLDDEIDDETKQPVKEMAPAVSAWAARWRIRQFQFVGGAPVTVYRELRRLRDQETAMGLSVEFAAAHHAADIGSWAGYVNAQGGPFVRREALAVRNWYETDEQPSAYGEDVVRIRGVYDVAVGQDCPIITRLIKWKIVPKRALDVALDLEGAPAPSRSSVNNCTGPGTGPQDDGTMSEMSMPDEPDFAGMTRKQRRRLLVQIKTAERQKAPPPPTSRTGPIVPPELVNRLRDSARVTLGIDLSLGEIKLLLAGRVMNADGQYYRAHADGDIYSAQPPVAPLARFEKLRAKYGPPEIPQQQKLLRDYLERMKPVLS